MIVRNWYKRNLSSAKKIKVQRSVASGEDPQKYVQLRLKSEDGKTFTINMDPLEAMELSSLLSFHAAKRVE